MAGKKKISKGIDPEYLKKQKAALVRRNRQVIYLNDKEMEAINQYCEKFRVGTKSVLFREAIMEKVLKELDDQDPKVCYLMALVLSRLEQPLHAQAWLKRAVDYDPYLRHRANLDPEMAGFLMKIEEDY